ncbi:hypothetical protein RF11_05564 [Thelohanellus kitauei]|uniref:Uncharacterized protein n=1 Tax=Thelohanellus kitauei TaxID=669202 RepID=A0A0C2MMS3_THEKT|nr:hypothetical protein RF11_05564 [Thelohanellus kitauei]
MRKILPVSTTAHGNTRYKMPHKDLFKCKYAFIRVDTLRKSLQHPYEGPYQIIDYGAKTFKIDINGRVDNVSIDRLKPAFLIGLEDLDSAGGGDVVVQARRQEIN